MLTERQIKNRLKKMEALNKKASELYNQAKVIKEELAVDCKHPSDYVSDYRWEHDDGYGKQTWYNGKYCSICGAIDYWNDGRFYKEKE